MFDFNKMLDEMLKAEEDQGRPVPKGFRMAVGGERLRWKVASMIACEIARDAERGVVHFGDVVTILERLPSLTLVEQDR